MGKKVTRKKSLGKREWPSEAPLKGKWDWNFDLRGRRENQSEREIGSARGN